MKNKISIIIVFVLFISPIISNAEISETRIASEENTLHNASISLNLADYDATSSLGIVDILINPETQSINAAGVKLKFSTTTLEIKGILTGNSFCDFFLENSFDNSAGELSLSGMKPYPGVATSSLLGQIIFEKINSGTSTISIIKNNSMVLANNGFATNILASTTDLEL